MVCVFMAEGMRKYFGTDGIRGTVNHGPLTAEIALRVGMAAGHVFQRGSHRHRVVIGKDTRLSGYMIEAALVSGFTSMGMNVFQFGPLPTPAVAFLTRSLRADLGVMISASHNSFEDNGVKLFGPDGYKLSDEVERDIEHHMDNGLVDKLVAPAGLGRARRIDDAQARYIEFAKRVFPRDLTLEGLRIVVDCANGAAYRVVPEALWELGAEVVPIGVAPDGFNINQNCGSTAPNHLQQMVRARGADIGIALDGDADRLVVVDERGAVIDGNQILGLIANALHKKDKLVGGGVVSTVMANLGLARYLESMGLTLERTPVGDRYVMEHMRAHEFNLGGEPSGHIIVRDHATTGDGLIAALYVLSVMCETQNPISKLCTVFEPVVQVLRNVHFEGRDGRPLEDDGVRKAIEAGKHRLGATGRLVVRKSGTEPLIRIMGEGDDEELVNDVVGSIVDIIQKLAA